MDLVVFTVGTVMVLMVVTVVVLGTVGLLTCVLNHYNQQYNPAVPCLSATPGPHHRLSTPPPLPPSPPSPPTKKKKPTTITATTTATTAVVIASPPPPPLLPLPPPPPSDGRTDARAPQRPRNTLCPGRKYFPSPRRDGVGHLRCRRRRLCHPPAAADSRQSPAR